MSKLFKSKLFYTVALCVCLSNLQAQVHNPNDDKLYVDVNSWIMNFEQKTEELMKNSPYLDTLKARKQLTEAEGKIATITKIKPQTKVLSSDKLAKQLKESMVLFANAYDCGNCHRTHVNPASGYIIDASGIVATNHHVVEGFCKSEKNKNLAMAVQTADGNVYFVTEIIASYEDADLCIVKIDTRGDKLKPLPLGDSAELGAEVYVMGHPNRMLFYFTKGLVARNYLNPAGRGKTSSTPEMDITADYAAGSSGGPVVDNKGNLVATVSSTRSIYYNQPEQKNLQMVVKQTKPVVSLKKMISWK